MFTKLITLVVFASLVSGFVLWQAGFFNRFILQGSHNGGATPAVPNQELRLAPSSKSIVARPIEITRYILHTTKTDSVRQRKRMLMVLQMLPAHDSMLKRLRLDIARIRDSIKQHEH